LTRRRLFLDDAFLLFAVACLIASSVVMFREVYYFYLEVAVLRGDLMASLLAYINMDKLLQVHSYHFAYLMLLWSTVFSIKWTYLAFFHPLLRAMDRKIIWFYWGSVGFSIISWAFMAVPGQLITCPYFGKSACKRVRQRCGKLIVAYNIQRSVFQSYPFPTLR
jgi:hypothetical protein